MIPHLFLPSLQVKRLLCSHSLLKLPFPWIVFQLSWLPPWTLSSPSLVGCFFPNSSTPQQCFLCLGREAPSPLCCPVAVPFLPSVFTQRVQNKPGACLWTCFLAEDTCLYHFFRLPQHKLLGAVFQLSSPGCYPKPAALWIPVLFGKVAFLVVRNLEMARMSSQAENWVTVQAQQLNLALKKWETRQQVVFTTASQDMPPPAPAKVDVLYWNSLTSVTRFSFFFFLHFFIGSPTAPTIASA